MPAFPFRRFAAAGLPPPDEPNKPLALFNIVGGCGALLLIGMWLYWAGKRRARSTVDGGKSINS